MHKVKYLPKFANVKNIIILALLGTTGCSHTLKMYSGNDKNLSELAVIYPISGNSPVQIRYLNDKRLNISTAYAVVNILPGDNKFTFVHFGAATGASSTKYDIIWTMYTVSANLKAGYTYIPWASDPGSIPPDEACLLEYRHEDFALLYGDNPRKIPDISDVEKVKVGCGRIINAKEYVKAYGHP